MDLGVGSFVFAQGLVFAIPLIKSPWHLTSPLLPKAFSIIRKTIPIIALGLIRVIIVKGTDYPEHETDRERRSLEFFHHPRPFTCDAPSHDGLLFRYIYRYRALSKLGLEDYAFPSPRVSVISANKEGIVSLIGYLAIHLLRLTTGTLILPPSPPYFRRIQRQFKRGARDPPDTGGSDFKGPLKELTSARQDDKTATELCV